jgi:hypothetical protein
MAIRVTCRSCEHSIRVKDELAGGRIKCPECGKPVAVPDEEIEERPRPGRSRERDEDEDFEERPRRKRSRERDEEDRPRGKSRPKQSKKGLIIGLSIGGGVLVVGVIVLLVFLLVSNNNPNVTEENFDRIKRGMSQEDVEKILGKGEKCSWSVVDKTLKVPPPKEEDIPKGGKVVGWILRWRNKSDTILLELHPPGTVQGGWYVRDLGKGKPVYRFLVSDMWNDGVRGRR